MLSEGFGKHSLLLLSFGLIFENSSSTVHASREHPSCRTAVCAHPIYKGAVPDPRAASASSCRAAVTRSQPAFPQAAPRSMGAVWGAGVLPLPASREARCRAAVTPQPTGFPSSSPALYGRGMGCRGTTPAREPRGPSPSGGNSAANRLSPYAPARIARRDGCRALALP